MLHVPTGANSFGDTPASWGTTRPAAANGTAVTPAVGSYGSYAQLFAATSVDSYGILININSNTASAASRNTVVDIGIDEAGGTSYTARITGLLCGAAATYVTSGNGVWYYFPLYIPAGSTVAARGNSTVVTAFRVGAMLMQKPMNPAMVRKGSFVETLGISGNAGTSITLGTTSEGSWTSVGTTTERCWWWQMGCQIGSADTSWSNAVIHFDIGVGDGTVGGTDVMVRDVPIVTSTAEAMTNAAFTVGCEWDVPAGSNIYVRGQHSGTADTTTVAVYAGGG